MKHPEPILNLLASAATLRASYTPGGDICKTGSIHDDDKRAPTLDQCWEGLAPAVPIFSPEEQRAAVTLYRELAKGKAVDAPQLGRALGVSPAEARAFLERDSIKAFTYADDQGSVLGFGGLATAQMHHRFEVDGRTLWTWCAWDSLLFPRSWASPTRVMSPDPENGELVRLLVSPDQIESAEPPDAVASFLLPDMHDLDSCAANVMAKFCHFIFFFTSQSSGERWIAKHPGTFLYSLDEAFLLGKRLNARNFGVELARRFIRGSERTKLGRQLALRARKGCQCKFDTRRPR